MLAAISEQPDELSGVSDVELADFRFSMSATLADGRVLKLALDTRTLLVTHHDAGRELLRSGYIHGKTAIDVVGQELNSTHKSLMPDWSWQVSCPGVGRAMFTTKEGPMAKIDLRGMDADQKWARLEVVAKEPYIIRSKQGLQLLQTAYDNAIKHALVDRLALNIIGNNNQVLAVFNPAPEQDNINEGELVDKLLDAHPKFRERYVWCPDPANDDNRGMWHCPPPTNVWRPVHNASVEKAIVAAFKSAPDRLSPKELCFVQTKRGRANLRSILASELLDEEYTFESRLDTDLDIFACANGTFDMANGGGLTPIRPDQLISKTTGWSYDPDLAKAKRPELELFLRQVLPHDDERFCVLSYMSGLLSGRRFAKRFAMLTDARGGNTGKTAFATLMTDFFGKFGSVGGTKFVTRPAVERGDRNSHDAGLVKCKGLRLLVGDELKNHMLLDEGIIKRFTGGPGQKGEGRHCGTGEDSIFVWTAGFMLLFNKGDAPKMDTADEAFWARAMVVPFRSKFVPAAELQTDAFTTDGEDGDTAEPHTFPVTHDMATKFHSWTSALMDLLLELHPGHVAALETIPQSMSEWKSEVQMQGNPMAAWLKERYAVTGDRKADKVAFTAAMGVGAPSSRFMADVKAYFTALGCWKERDGVKQDNGSFKTTRHVAVGVRSVA